MPEGPSIILLKEEVQHFAGRKIVSADGDTKKIDLNRIQQKKVLGFRSWGKHFLIEFSGFTLRIHFLLFGSYRVNDPKDRIARLHLQFTNGDLYLYSCSVKILEGDLNSQYDWTGDVMNPAWDKRKAKKKIKTLPTTMVCDTLLHQDIFAGVGNIIKNEVLFRIRVHPESINGKLSDYRLNLLIQEARQYSFDFLAWKRDYVLRKHWLVHTKKVCVRCQGPIVRKVTGHFARRSFFCPNCQPLYT
jgi:endonuclease VIII